ncbi:ABC transporter, permease protein [Dehalobacter sp. UNSWDHB]|uniref:ABC transporter permease subunit n=1 Tax=Dehalobacter sp. UNSWDHB TaxID=1339256 RepID=UPI000387644D|nr:ABC transporter permease subunit [Dehalobacter sp. UNSWDHB]EQB21438.1 ABC transporter, permease protein [Dehalobacter sp. UNSWDHB]
MNIFLRELKAHRKSLIIWSIAIFLMIVSSVGKFTAYAETGQSMNALLSQIPSSIKAVLGMGDFDLTKVSGFYGMLYLYLLLLATVHASLLGANIISKEEQDKTTEFLLVKPVSRQKVITAKLLASLCNIIVFNIVTLIFSVVLMGKYAKGENLTGEISILMVGMFILQLMFLLIGTATAAVSRHPRSAASVATAILLVTFIISSAINMNSSLDRLKYITPFEYFKAERLLNGGGFEPVFLVLSFVIIAVLVFVTYVAYQKRDLNV